MRGESARSIERMVRVDRRTVASYVQAAEVAGLVRDGDESQITDELLGRVVGISRPARPDGQGDAWRTCEEHGEFLAGLVKQGKQLTTIRVQLRRHHGVEVPYATLHRFAVSELGFGRRKRVTMPLADGEPGSELQVDFGRMGLLHDPVAARRRVCHAFVFAASFSRHLFFWLTFSQKLQAVIDGFEAAWSFYGGVFRVVIPDNMRTIITTADRLTPRFNQALVEYAQSRGFLIDPARVGTPTDKARVERNVRYVRDSFWASEDWRDLEHARSRAAVWCREDAGMRIHRSTQQRPYEMFVAHEQPLLLPAPVQPYDLPTYRTARVARDFHIEVDWQLYSVPHAFVGCWVDVRADAHLVTVRYDGQVIKQHVRTDRRRTTDPADMPAERRDYAMRDINALTRKAAAHGPSIGVYATRLLDCELPWTRMRIVYALMGLVGRYGAERVEAACTKALSIDECDSLNWPHFDGLRWPHPRHT